MRYLPTRLGPASHTARLAMLLGGAALVTGCTRAETEETVTAGYPSVDAVTDRPEDYLGERITVRGTMKEAWSPQGFVLQDHDWILPEELLVLTPNEPDGDDAGSSELEGRKITATGTLRRIVVSEVERESDFDLDPAFELEIEHRPVLVADRVWPDPVGDEATRRGPEVTDVMVLLPVPGPSALIGERARLTNVEVRSRVGEQGLWVGPSHSAQVFVHADNGMPAAGVDRLGPNDRVTVVGTIQRVPERATVQNEWGLDSSQAVIVARQEALYVEADTIIGSRD